MLAWLANHPQFAAFLVGVLALCLVTSLLALLLVLADATINHYGTVRIDLTPERSIEVEGGRTLLSTLKDEGIFISSACGGRGSCGLCKAKVVEGGGGILPTETPWLTPQEQQDGMRLCCQLKVKQDLSLSLPEALFKIRQYETEVVGLRDLTYDIKEVRLKLLDPPTLEFTPGQFVQIEVPPYALSDEPVYRAYSISSEPAEEGIVELEVRRVPNGICTTYVHEHLHVGSRVTINGPHGEFGVRDGTGTMICIAGGSGMAPIKSMLLDLLRSGCTRPIRYFFGARSVRDLFLVEEMRELEQKLPDFQFIPALSDPAPEDQWTGETGLITEVVEREVGTGAGQQAYLCGSPLMIDACIKVLAKKEIPSSMIFYDKFA